MKFELYSKQISYSWSDLVQILFKYVLLSKIENLALGLTVVSLSLNLKH